ncbi:MAG: polyisoprenoid-binding protein [Gemmatimonas sp.]|nr:polyisoprenoid-binding protein [Gemmatimonas sp.]
MQWTLDTTHTQVGFSVKHMAISTVRGRFTKFDGTGETDASGKIVKARFTIDVASIDTNQEQRDAHLRSADFFDTEQFPAIVFESTSITQQGSDITMTGDFTMHGVTKPLTLTGETAPVVKDPWGMTRTALTLEGKLNRKEWGLTWNQALEFGGLMVSEDVKLSIELEAVGVAEAQGA